MISLATSTLFGRRWPLILGVLLLLSGLALTAYAVSLGQASFHLLVVFPVITSNGLWGAAGMLLMIAGIFLCFFAPVLAQNRRAQTHYTQVQHTQVQTRHAHSGGHDGTGKEKRGGFGGVVLIGPIPLVFGSDKKMALLAAIVAILVILSLLLFFIPMLRAA